MTDPRADIQSFLAKLFSCDDQELAELAKERFANDVVLHVSAPVERLDGRDAVMAGLIAPLRRAVRFARRRDLMLFGGTNRRDVGGDWIADVTHITGLFEAPLWGIAPTGKLIYLRIGEFWRHNDAGQIIEGRIIIDLLDLLHQIGRWPLSEPHYGAPVTFPAPATQDGLIPTNRDDGTRSLDIVEAMLSALHVYNPETFGSDGQTGGSGTWTDDFAWYGPGGIGSTAGWDGFVNHHRAQFLRAFPDRKGGNHYCRIGDGNYAAVSGWPSMTMTHHDTYLGVPGSGNSLTLRVMDFYRCTEDRIAENWVLLDYIHLLHQMGVDAIADAAVTGDG